MCIQKVQKSISLHFILLNLTSIKRTSPAARAFDAEVTVEDDEVEKEVVEEVEEEVQEEVEAATSWGNKGEDPVAVWRD